ncbi:DUF6597 domain-containing transcriptional factor, partial [Streptomyces mirabilis]|uniref:DUF6597 domain-containing transcriptional factor n=1 Tax=Streptomyces mirabilis TaxID=68239 RepID=UPI0033CE5CB0
MYVERPSRLTGAVVWSRGTSDSTVGSVLPDGCMDLLWHEGRLLVAGPDTRAYVPEGAAGHWAGVRFYPGTGPTFLGVPAHVDHVAPRGPTRLDASLHRLRHRQTRHGRRPTS